jgi:acetylornithine/N-succinyldiaminopimelate aminotransferase
MSITPLMPVYPRCAVRPVRGEHCHLISEDGTRYLDFAAGIAVNLLGHSHAGLIGAIQRQAATLMHVSNLYGSPQGETLAQRLVDLTFADTVFFTNSGAEAVECAIKTARAYHQSAGDESRFELITFNNAFHGRTMATISASSQEKMHKGFLPLLPAFATSSSTISRGQGGDRSAHRRLPVEPIQGEGGIASPRRLPRGPARACRRARPDAGVRRSPDRSRPHGHVLRLRTVRSRARHPRDRQGIGGGFPLGACLATERAARGMTFGTHGSTYGGNPLAMAAGNAVLDVVANDRVPRRSARQG